ncbi:nickel-responsive transcriptional regulator NikR [Gluconacetobacter azotocaptans]|uniref:Putative nickel-responsive regulator n=1 Tax=Gluconacetobacter azotocaptans TaxID=142834 RepID=A0A7W4PD48_9PROT|nr:nickel-responsive transcriptional regulator NikR [Gluconacetobacter azotocaptans]MBB2189330.1 nickel-responsive transcriptional regulator NikR [Gluconacetobacter azotocaptans]MBM9401275.1 nickel-responsive transcriptional regulator NikR [Gluconacetobacter azotocaptans]GBQ28638.1 putative transcriptional regulator [Gluconacetobacter azotocaptans DSM 13594]
MERITITIDAELLAIVDGVMARRGYASRSEAIRDMIRDAASREDVLSRNGVCVAVLDYVYDHETRSLAQRLTHELHAHHHLSVASMHIHLDHDRCLETTVLRGPASALQKLSDTITTQRGVHHANLHVIPLAAQPDR